MVVPCGMNSLKNLKAIVSRNRRPNTIGELIAARQAVDGKTAGDGEKDECGNDTERGIIQAGWRTG